MGVRVYSLLLFGWRDKLEVNALVLFCYCFLKRLLRTVFENTEKNCSCYLNLVFFFLCFSEFKKKRKKRNQTCFPYFPYPSFLEQKTVFKSKNQHALCFPKFESSTF